MSNSVKRRVQQMTTVQVFEWTCDQCGRTTEDRKDAEQWLRLTWPEMDKMAYWSYDVPSDPADLCSPQCVRDVLDRVTALIEAAS